MSEETEALSEAIQLGKEAMLNDLLNRLGYDEIDEDLFQDLLSIINAHEEKRFKYFKALESQEVIDYYMKNKLV